MRVPPGDAGRSFLLSFPRAHRYVFPSRTTISFEADPSSASGSHHAMVPRGGVDCFAPRPFNDTERAPWAHLVVESRSRSRTKVESSDSKSAADRKRFKRARDKLKRRVEVR